MGPDQLWGPYGRVVGARAPIARWPFVATTVGPCGPWRAIVHELISQHGQQISLAEIVPLDDALLEHWVRVDIEP